MVINKIHEDIFEITNFLSEEEVLKIMNFVSNLHHKSWQKQADKYYFKVNGNKIFSFLDNDVKNRVNDVFSSEYDIQQFLAIYKYGESDKHNGHTDDGTEKNVKYGVVIYLNEDFSGGEVFYPELGITYKPRARSMLVHKASVWHEVLPVKNGTRYVLTTFALDKEIKSL
jgi:hypothetical protein